MCSAKLTTEAVLKDIKKSFDGKDITDAIMLRVNALRNEERLPRVIEFAAKALTLNQDALNYIVEEGDGNDLRDFVEVVYNECFGYEQKPFGMREYAGVLAGLLDYLNKPCELKVDKTSVVVVCNGKQYAM